MTKPERFLFGTTRPSDAFWQAVNIALGVAVGFVAVATALLFLPLVNPAATAVIVILFAVLTLLIQLLFIHLPTDLSRDDPLHAQLLDMVEHCAKDVTMEMPRVGIFDFDKHKAIANAGAIELGPGRARIFYTSRLLDALHRDWIDIGALRAVTYHELAHLEHNDVYMRFLVWIGTAVVRYTVLLAAWDMIWHADDRGLVLANPLMLVAIIVFPLACSLIMGGLSRSHERRADEMAGHFVSATDLAAFLIWARSDWAFLTEIGSTWPATVRDKNALLTRIEYQSARLRAEGDVAMADYLHEERANALRKAIDRQRHESARRRRLRLIMRPIRMGLGLWWGHVTWNRTHPPIDDRIKEMLAQGQP